MGFTDPKMGFWDPKMGFGDPKMGFGVRVNALVDVLPPEADGSIVMLTSDQKPDVVYADIGGMDIQKQEVREAVELPLTHFELYKQIGIDPPRGVLMYGPPGCGKTMLAKAVAHHTTGETTWGGFGATWRSPGILGGVLVAFSGFGVIFGGSWRCFGVPDVLHEILEMFLGSWWSPWVLRGIFGVLGDVFGFRVVSMKFWRWFWVPDVLHGVSGGVLHSRCSP
uniref:ATPase AAA-type core domain-containing protein n=1 Tax=Cyanoderma ruficeps TaxID=181631 RepID=A0A8C3QKR7_9PASS